MESTEESPMVLRIYDQTSVVPWPFTSLTEKLDTHLKKRGSVLLDRRVYRDSSSQLRLNRRYLSSNHSAVAEAKRIIWLPEDNVGLQEIVGNTSSTEFGEISADEMTLDGDEALVPHQVLIRKLLNPLRYGYQEIKTTRVPFDKEGKLHQTVSFVGDDPDRNPSSKIQRDIRYTVQVNHLTDRPYREKLAELLGVPARNLPFGQGNDQYTLFKGPSFSEGETIEIVGEILNLSNVF